MNECKGFLIVGILFVVVCLVLVVIGVSQLIGLKLGEQLGMYFFVGVGLLVLMVFLLKGFFQVVFNEGQVLQLFGKYVGMVCEEGLCWINLFYSCCCVLLCVCNFESGKLKVNDSDGNLIEIVVVVVWQVLDMVEVVFCVDDYENFVYIQSELVLCQMVQNYLYDVYDEKKFLLCSYGEVINNYLCDEIQVWFEKVGVQVIEVCISYFVYVQEIVQVMLQCQQVNVIVVVCECIVEGVVGMVVMVLDKLCEQGVVELDEECKVVMVSNFLVVLCGDCVIQFVVNVGSLYS